jgi:hypothetical protein
MNHQVSIQEQVHFTRRRAGRKKLESGRNPSKTTAKLPPAVPRISRLMALAIHFDQLIREGVVADYADLARLGRVTRARVTQIMNLLNLAPDIQEAILFLPTVQQGRTPVIEKRVRPIVAEMDWQKQRRMWRSLS